MFPRGLFGPGSQPGHQSAQNPRIFVRVINLDDTDVDPELLFALLGAAAGPAGPATGTAGPATGTERVTQASQTQRTEIFQRLAMLMALRQLFESPAREEEENSVFNTRNQERLLDLMEHDDEAEEVPARFCCQKSGLVMDDPVYNKKEGLARFERKVLVDAIEKTGKDPVTEESLTLEDVAADDSLKNEINAYLTEKEAQARSRSGFAMR